MQPKTLSPRTLALAVSAVVLTAAVVVAAFIFLAEKPVGLLRPDDAKIVATGKAIYMEHCASCHGENLEGQPNWRRRGEDGLLPAPPHDRSGHTWHHTDDVLFAITKLGTAKFIGDDSYKSNMLPFEGTLSDDQIVAVLSFIKSTWPEDIRARHDRMNAQVSSGR